jgi:hypothetical protein
MIQVEIKHVGKHRNKLIFANRNEANTVLQSNVMESYNVKAYIPSQILYSTGVISGVPEDITMEELAAEVAKKHPVNGVERIRKYNRTTKEMDDTTSVKITLKQNHIPETIYAFYMRLEFRPFVYRPKICANCLRFGHSKVKCKSRQRCTNCGGEEHSFEECQAEQRCVHCNSQTHRSSDKKCKQYGLQLEMNRLMACEKLTYMEAKEKVEKTKKIPTERDFPHLTTDAENTPLAKMRYKTPKSKPIKQQKENKPQQQQKHQQQQGLYTADAWNVDPQRPVGTNPHRTSEVQRLLADIKQNYQQIITSKDSPQGDSIKIKTSELFEELSAMVGLSGRDVSDIPPMHTN